MPTLDYEGSRGRAARWGPWLADFLTCAIVASVVSFMLGNIVPKFSAVYRDFKLRLPLPTLALVEATSWFNSNGWVVVWIAPVAVPFLTSWPWRQKPHDTRARLTLLAVALFGAMITLFFAALVLPMLDLVEGISSSK